MITTTTESLKQQIPLWITIVCWLIILLGLYVSITLYLPPSPSIFPDTDLNAKGIGFLFHMWGARQLSIVLALAYAAFRKSADMLKLALGIYCMMNLQDLIIGVVHHDTGLVIGAGIFTLLPAAMIYTLNKK